MLWVENSFEDRSKSDSAHREEQGVNQNGQIHEEGAVPDVIEVIMDVFVYLEGPIGTQLPEACDTGYHLESLPMPVAVALHDEGHLWPRSHQRHIAQKDVYQLRQFI